MNLDFHNDPDLFRASVGFTVNETGFAANLIEKDYLCSVLLDYLLRSSDGTLIFKGGTSLAKVHWNFSRLSEDLDFIIPMPVDAKRKERSKKAAIYKKAVSDLPDAQPLFQLKEPLEGSNESRQYIAVITYKSLVNTQEETIKIEIGLREPLLKPVLDGKASTLVKNAANPDDGVAPLSVKCLSFEEALAEKFRAALSRQDVAIRDFYDIDYAMVQKSFNAQDKDLIEMVRKKLAIPGNDPPDVSKGRIAALSDQMEARLKPVLRPKDYEAFNLDRAINHVIEAHSRL